MIRHIPIAMLAAALGFLVSPLAAKDWIGPGRFCGYSPVIDLLPGEQVIPLEGGIHMGSFRWEGGFGAMKIVGIGWASPPRGFIEAGRTSKGMTLFRQRRMKGEYRVGIWNRSHGVAYFSSPNRFTAKQRAAIDRVDLHDEGDEPQGCKWRTIFSWEAE